MLSVVSAAATGVRTGHVLVAVAYLIAFVLLPKGGPRRSEGLPPLHYGGRPMRRPGP